MTARVDDIVFWIAKDEAGVVRGGVIDPNDCDAAAWQVVLTPLGWTHELGTPDPPMSPEVAHGSIGELVMMLQSARLMNSASDPRGRAGDAPGPWRIEATLRALMPR